MKLFRILSVAIIFVATQLSAPAMENEFIRTVGGYSLDSNGSTLTITQTASNAWTLKVTWKTKDSSSTDQSPDLLKAAGWFVFVEKPERIWIFDGVDRGHLLTWSEKEMGNASWSPKIIASCPQKVWDALPEDFRKNNRKYRKDE
jgi:hypothetical protein